MESAKTSFSLALRGLGVFIFTLVTLATPALFGQLAARPSDVLGMTLGYVLLWQPGR